MPFDSDSFAAVPLRSGCVVVPKGVAGGDTQAAAAAIAAAGHLLQRIRGDEALSRLLASSRFTRDELVTGATLQVAAEDIHDLCRVSQETLSATLAERDAVWMTAREEYLVFRATVRLECPDICDQRLLLVTGTVAALLPDFVAQAAASYRAATRPRVLAALQTRGFAPGRVIDAMELLQQLVRLEELVASSHARVHRLLEEREVAIGMLNGWIRDLLQVMRRAFGGTIRPPRRRSGVRIRQISVRHLRRAENCPVNSRSRNDPPGWMQRRF